MHPLLQKLPANIVRIAINCWAPFLGMGIKVKKISPDYRCIQVAMKLHWYNKNYVGTHFGGSIFSLTDPFYMFMLLRNLGKGYIVWDIAARIEFKKPGRGTLHATFSFTPEEIAFIREQADKNEKYVFERPVDVIDDDGNVIASAVRTLYVKKKKPAPL